jgi:hypothetical protein
LSRFNILPGLGVLATFLAFRPMALTWIENGSSTLAGVNFADRDPRFA